PKATTAWRRKPDWARPTIPKLSHGQRPTGQPPTLLPPHANPHHPAPIPAPSAAAAIRPLYHLPPLRRRRGHGLGTGRSLVPPAVHPTRPRDHRRRDEPHPRPGSAGSVRRDPGGGRRRPDRAAPTTGRGTRPADRRQRRVGSRTHARDLRDRPGFLPR